MVKPAPGGQLTPWKLVAPSTTSASSTSRCAPPFPCTPIPPLHACSMLTCLLLCHRSLLGRIFESKNISHIGVDSARRACHLRRGRARAREAVARGLGRSVLCRVLCYPRPARKPPVHGICCRTFVSCRVPFSGIYIYIVYKCVCPWLSADHSRETSENGISIPSTRHADAAWPATPRSNAERTGHVVGSSVRIVDQANPHPPYGIGTALQGSNSPEPAADTRI